MIKHFKLRSQVFHTFFTENFPAYNPFQRR